MSRRFVSFVLAGALLASCIPAADAAGPSGATLVGAPRLPLPFFPFLPPRPPRGGGTGGGTGTGTGTGTGNGGGTIIPRNPFNKSTTVTTSTTTANLTLSGQNGAPFVGVTGSVVYQTVTVSTTVLGFTYSSTSATISGHIARTPTLDNNTVNFVLYFAGVGSGRNLASAVVNSAGNGSFSLSSLNGANLPLILEGDVVYANANIGGQFVTLKAGEFGPPVVTSTTYAP